VPSNDQGLTEQRAHLRFLWLLREVTECTYKADGLTLQLGPLDLKRVKDGCTIGKAPQSGKSVPSAHCAVLLR
jgi:hypothetical protein